MILYKAGHVFPQRTQSSSTIFPCLPMPVFFLRQSKEAYFICKYIQGTYEDRRFSSKKIKFIATEKISYQVIQNPILKYFIGQKFSASYIHCVQLCGIYSILHIFQMSSCDVCDSYCKKGVKLAWHNTFLSQIHCLLVFT